MLFILRICSILCANPTQLAEAIVSLLSDDNLRKELGERARDFIFDRYNWRSVQELSTIYEELLDTNR